MAQAGELSAEQHLRRRHLSRAWAVVVIVWAFGRALLVWAAVGDYGINPWWYLAIDLVCASIDAVTTPKTVLALIDNQYRRAAIWGSASVTAFVIPDLYIFVATDKLPRSIIVAVLVVIAVTLTFSIISVVRKVRSGRAAQALLDQESIAPDAK